MAVTGIGPIQVTGANSYDGGTFVSGGTLQVGNAGAIPHGAGKGDVTVSGTGVFDLAGVNTSINGLWGNGTVDSSAISGITILAAGNNNATSTFLGTIQNSNSGTGGLVGLTKVGNGALTLGGTNTYLGGTTVNSGVLIVTNNEGIEDGTNLYIGNAGNLTSFGGVDPAGAATATAPGSTGPRAGTGHFGAAGRGNRRRGRISPPAYPRSGSAEEFVAIRVTRKTHVARRTPAGRA